MRQSANTSSEQKHLAGQRAVRETKQPYATEMEDREEESVARTREQEQPTHVGRGSHHDE
jgi:hypothetical protein